MAIKYYKQILKMFPSFNGVPRNKNGSFYPELGPLMLINIINKIPNKTVIQVSDSKFNFNCIIKRKDMITKVSKIGTEQIIFLMGVNINRVNDTTELEANSIYTLKEINDGLIKPSDKNQQASDCKNTKNKEGKMSFITLNERWKQQGKII